MKEPLLGGISRARFLREYWQKKPLLVRNALPGFKGIISPAALRRLSLRDDADARLVVQRGRRWEVAGAPLTPEHYAALPPSRWTLLVHGVDLHHAAAQRLLLRFSFVPYARLDDLMVSYAAPGGGVGPHFDSYDVFLLQAAGRRRWRISSRSERTLVAGASLRILKHFRPQQEWVLEPGDLLYLPPGCAHDGVALGDCMTYSIGFRAPSHQELAEQFLVFLQDRITREGMYADPDLTPQPRPGRIPAAMVRNIARVVNGIRWSARDVERFAGMLLSEPKPQVFFSPPRPALSAAQFQRQARRRGVALDLKTRMLFDARTVFINGEAQAALGSARGPLTRLADERSLPPGVELDPSAAQTLYRWYCAGYIVVNPAPDPRP